MPQIVGWKFNLFSFSENENVKKAIKAVTRNREHDDEVLTRRERETWGYDDSGEEWKLRNEIK